MCGCKSSSSHIRATYVKVPKRRCFETSRVSDLGLRFSREPISPNILCLGFDRVAHSSRPCSQQRLAQWAEHFRAKSLPISTLPLPLFHEMPFHTSKKGSGIWTHSEREKQREDPNLGPYSGPTFVFTQSSVCCRNSVTKRCRSGNS